MRRAASTACCASSGENAGEPDENLMLLNGRIAHGLQLTTQARRSEPTTYFGPESGAGLAIRPPRKRLAGSPMRVGVIGLGVGTLAAWSRAGDSFHFYELDPQVARLSEGTPRTSRTCARRAARSLSRSATPACARERAPAGVRRARARRLQQRRDPGHLLTLEAFELYLRHLAPDGRWPCT
jgi:hypothetical protein